MKIAIMSDSHDRWDNLTKAISLANDKSCSLLLFAGDLIAPPGIEILESFAGDIKFVWGNNEGEKLIMTRKMDASKKILLAGDTYENSADGIRIYMNHYPRPAELAALSLQFDLSIYGHTHEYDNRMIGKCLLINPGEIQGYRTGESGFVVFDTTTSQVERILIS